MVDIVYAFLRVTFVATGFGHNDHGSFPTGDWHLDLCTGDETLEVEVLPGPVQQPPVTAMARGLTTLAADGWRPQETARYAKVIVGDWTAEHFLIRLARASASDG